jgi:hypothetical protein
MHALMKTYQDDVLHGLASFLLAVMPSRPEDRDDRIIRSLCSQYPVKRTLVDIMRGDAMSPHRSPKDITMFLDHTSVDHRVLIAMTDPDGQDLRAIMALHDDDIHRMQTIHASAHRSPDDDGDDRSPTPFHDGAEADRFVLACLDTAVKHMGDPGFPILSSMTSPLWRRHDITVPMERWSTMPFTLQSMGFIFDQIERMDPIGKGVVATHIQRRIHTAWETEDAPSEILVRGALRSGNDPSLNKHVVPGMVLALRHQPLDAVVHEHLHAGVAMAMHMACPDRFACPRRERIEEDMPSNGEPIEPARVTCMTQSFQFLDPALGRGPDQMAECLIGTPKYLTTDDVDLWHRGCRRCMASGMESMVLHNLSRVIGCHVDQRSMAPDLMRDILSWIPDDRVVSMAPDALRCIISVLHPGSDGLPKTVLDRIDKQTSGFRHGHMSPSTKTLQPFLDPAYRKGALITAWKRLEPMDRQAIAVYMRRISAHGIADARNNDDDTLIWARDLSQWDTIAEHGGDGLPWS